MFITFYAGYKQWKYSDCYIRIIVYSICSKKLFKTQLFVIFKTPLNIRIYLNYNSVKNNLLHELLTSGRPLSVCG